MGGGSDRGKGGRKALLEAITVGLMRPKERIRVLAGNKWPTGT